MLEFIIALIVVYIVGTSLFWTLGVILGWCQGSTISEREYELEERVKELEDE